jgi:ubiquinone/menaquinone biosynthesis C-methylase UbiE
LDQFSLEYALVTPSGPQLSHLTAPRKFANIPANLIKGFKMAENKTTHFGYQTVRVEEKAQKVGEVFHSVAARYDLMNDLMSLGIHRLWKRYTIDCSGVRAGMRVLDIAGGTGDLTEQFARRVGASGEVVLADINDAMLAVGRDKLRNRGIVGNVRYVQANAEELPFADDSFDIITIAFGLRNVTDKQKALESMFRVLKPGGHMFLQVPLQVGATRVPPEPEFHADNTPVFFNFGWDLTHRLRATGFDVDVLVTEEWRDVLRGTAPAIASNGDGFHVEDLIASARTTLDLERDLVSIADRATAYTLGVLPPYHHVTWRCRKTS